MTGENEKSKIASFDVGFGPGASGRGAAPPEDPSRGAFRIGVVSGLSPRPEFATSPRDPGGSQAARPVGVDRASFDEIMAELAPELAIDVTDPHDVRGKPVRVDLRFAKMRDFRPEILAEQVHLLRSLRAERSAAPRVSGGRASEGPAGGKSLLDSLLDGDDPVPGEASATPSAGPHLAFTRLLGEVLHHPEVRRLESAWRGLKWLVDRAGACEGVSIQVVAARVEDVEPALDALALGDEPLGLILVDHELGATPRDLDRMDRWAQRAEAIGAPLVVNARPELLGFDDLGALSRTQRRVRSSEDPRAAALRNVAARDWARWISLAANGLVARPRHTTESARLGGIPFEEGSDLFIGAVWAVGALASASFARCGWPCALTGTSDGRLESLNVRSGDDRGEQVSLPLEALVREDVAAEAAGAGVCLLSCAPNRDLAFLLHAPVLFRGPVGASGTSAAASSTLAEQLFVARVGQAVLQLAAAIPRDTPPSVALEVARVTLAELFSGSPGKVPALDLAISGDPPVLELTVRPRGFLGLRLEEATLAARLA